MVREKGQSAASFLLFSRLRPPRTPKLKTHPSPPLRSAESPPMPSQLPPPCLTIRVPGSSHSRTHSTPAFGKISTYSHRVGPRRPPVQRPQTSAVAPRPRTRSDPLDTISHPYPDDSEEERLDESPFGDNFSDSSDLDVAHVLKARRACAPSHPHNHSTINLGIEPPTPDLSRAGTDITALKHSRRTASIYSSSDVATLPSLPPSPTGTYISVSLANFGSSNNSSLAIAPFSISDAGSSRIANSLASRSSSSLEVHAVRTLSRQSTRSNVIPPAYERQDSTNRTVLGEGPGGRRETPADRLKRLYLCPWETLSPNTYRLRKEASGNSSTVDLEKQQHPHQQQLSPPSPTRAQSRRIKLLSSICLSLLSLLIFIDLIVLNVRSFNT